MRDRINEALKDAMRAKDQLRTCTLRLMIAAIKDRDIALRGDEDGSGAVLDGAGILALLAKMVKQRQESAAAYSEAGRMELAAREEAEIAVIREFMPRQMNDAEIRHAIAQAIGDTGAHSIRDMGKVMGRLKTKYSGRMDFGDAGAQVKQALG